MASQKTKRNVQHAIGAAGGIAVGGGGSLAASYAISKAIGSETAKAAGGRVSAVIGSRAMSVLSAAGRLTGYGLAAYGAAGLAAGTAEAARTWRDSRKRGERATTLALAKGFGKGLSSPLSTAHDMIFTKATAQQAKKPAQRPTAQSSPPNETMEDAMARVGGKFGDPEQYRLAAENDRRNMVKAKTQSERDAFERRALANESIYKQRTGKHVGPTLPGTATGEQVSSEQKPAASKSSVLRDVIDFFRPEKSDLHKQTVRELEEVRRDIALENAGKGKGAGPGRGREYDKLTSRRAELENRLKDIEKTEKNPYGEAFKTVAPIASSVGGFYAGKNLFSGTKELAEGAAKVGKEVGKLGKEAAAILGSRKNSVIVGTPVGDKAKALINEAYARGGAKPAFPSPGYPASKETAEQVFGRTGRATAQSYITPGYNMLLAAGAVAASMTDTLAPTEGAKQGERIGAGVEAGIAVGQWAALSKAPAIRPAAAAISAIDGLRHRVTRETAAGAAKVGAAKIGAVISQARGSAAVARNRTAVRVSGSAVGRDGAALSAVKASAELGERRALANANVQVARNIGKRRTIESGQDVTAARKGMPLSRPDTPKANRLLANDNRRIQPTPGRYFTRSYHRGPKAGTVEQVRKPSAR